MGVQSLPDPHGALRPGQRLMVAVYPSPGPWIIDASDSKIESAAKISPVGVFMQGFQDEHTLGVSKDMQQYMPRPHLGLEVHDALIKALRLAISSKTVVTTTEAGIVPDQLIAWNKAKDQLDWRLHYYGPDPDAPAPRDYARALTLDDALILDVNVSYGTTASDDNKLLPYMSAASRVYRGDTSRLIWEHEDEVSDVTSSSTLAEFKVQPWDLTNRLEKIAPDLGKAVAASFTKAFFTPIPGATPAAGTTPGMSPSQSGPGFGGAQQHGGGLVPMSFFQSTGAPAGFPLPPLPSSTTVFAPPVVSTVPVVSTATVVVPAVSTTTIASPIISTPTVVAIPVVSTDTIAVPAPVVQSTPTAPTPPAPPPPPAMPGLTP